LSIDVFPSAEALAPVKFADPKVSYDFKYPTCNMFAQPLMFLKDVGKHPVANHPWCCIPEPCFLQNTAALMLRYSSQPFLQKVTTEETVFGRAVM